mmetsp:Transcript_39474/g.57990  ORF Transcript_39474/g.57990 Transcript_39474/m.57990 type:complete len:289 (+) Transcript_39474:37-903(+)
MFMGVQSTNEPLPLQLDILTKMSCLLSLLMLTLMLPEASSSSTQQVSMGTTILAARYADGVVVGADTRTSVSGYVSNRFATKLTFVLDNKDEPTRNNGEQQPHSTVCICRSGSAADTQHLCAMVSDELHANRMLKHDATWGTVKNAAYLIRHLVSSNADRWSCSVICAGYDHVQKKGRVYSVSPSGALMEHEQLALGGSGSTYIMGHADAYCKSSKVMMSEEECIEFVGRSIELAMSRDGSSGGYVYIYVIDQHGKRPLVRMPSVSAGTTTITKDGNNSLTNFAPAIR